MSSRILNFLSVNVDGFLYDFGLDTKGLEGKTSSKVLSDFGVVKCWEVISYVNWQTMSWTCFQFFMSCILLTQV